MAWSKGWAAQTLDPESVACQTLVIYSVLNHVSHHYRAFRFHLLCTQRA